MKLFEAVKNVQQLIPITVPDLRYIRSAADRVRERWPDVQVSKMEKEREALAQKLRNHVERNDWKDTRLSFVVSAASAVFDSVRRERQDMAWTRDFLYAEIAVSTSKPSCLGCLELILKATTPKVHTLKPLRAHLEKRIQR